MRNLPFRIARSACVWIALFAAFQAQGAPPTQDSVEAVWKAQRLEFFYRSLDTLYSCAGLEEKTRIILSQLGARGRVALRRVRCRDFSRLVQIEVFMESPIVATPENIRDLTRYDSEDVLIARVRGEALPSPEDLERFPAEWKSVTFRGDCALVQQLRQQVLPKMSVQVINDTNRSVCSQGSPRLAVVALLPTNDGLAGTDAKRAANDRIDAPRMRLGIR